MVCGQAWGTRRVTWPMTRRAHLPTGGLPRIPARERELENKNGPPGSPRGLAHHEGGRTARVSPCKPGARLVYRAIGASYRMRLCGATELLPLPERQVFALEADFFAEFAEERPTPRAADGMTERTSVWVSPYGVSKETPN